MIKEHWNSVILDGSIPTGEIERMIVHSYGLVVNKLKKIEREALELSYGKDVLYRDCSHFSFEFSRDKCNVQITAYDQDRAFIITTMRVIYQTTIEVLLGL